MEFANLFQNISVGDVIIWSLAVGFVGSKIGKLLESYRSKKNGVETKDKTLQEHTVKIETLEKNLDGISEKIDAIQDGINELSKLSDQREARRLRGEILKFSDGIRRGKKPTKDAFENIFENNEEYENLIAKRHIKNGYTQTEFAFIKKSYESMFGVSSENSNHNI